MICKYCGRIAVFRFKNGIWCCSKSSNSCPDVRKRRGISLGDRTGKNNPMFGRKQSDSFKKIQSERIKGSKNPVFKLKENPSKRLDVRKKLKDVWKDPNYRRIMSDKAKLKFLDKNFLDKFIRGCRTKPNKLEKIMINLLKDCFYEKYEYVGDFKLWIDGKNPDFIDKENKKIIEFFGRYWHDDSDEVNRKEHFEKNGYKTLIIWEEELSDLESLKRKILDFDI